MKFVCTSDIHGSHKELVIPDGDVLIIAGDISERNKEIIEFNEFLSALPHKYKIAITGNHELLWEMKYGSLEDVLTNAIVLNNKGITIENIRIWGVPWLGNTYLIPDAIDILISHIPPFSKCDLSKQGVHRGSRDLYEKVRKIRPKYHLFGHIHEAYGVDKEIIDGQEIIFMNVSSGVDFSTQFNAPMVFEL